MEIGLILSRDVAINCVKYVRTMMFKNQTYSSGKISKKRLTAVLRANANGTEMLILLVIGNVL